MGNVILQMEVLAQADISMTTHWYNRTGYNPAFIARTDYAYIFSNIRQQWIGIKGAPTVFNVQVSNYFHKIHSAFGLSFVSDNIGVTQVLNPMLSYAFRIGNEENWALSLGLSGGIFHRSIDGTRFEAEVTNDPSINYDTDKYMQPDANAGIEFQSTYIIIGLSSTHLFSIGKSDETYLNANHRYGYFIFKNNNPEAFYYRIGVQLVNRNNLTVTEGNVFFRLKHATGLMKGPREILDFGLTVRSSRQMSFLIGILVTPNLRLGYAYDHSFIKGYSPNGTHEIMLEYRLYNRFASTRFQCGIAKPWYQ